jgi:hypothetical protein
MVIQMQSDMCVYTDMLHNIETLVGQKKQKKVEAAINATCQGNRLACHKLGSPNADSSFGYN